jgi:hypothetical protein
MKILAVIIGGNSIANYGIIKHSLNSDENNKILPKVDKVALIYTNGTKKTAESFKKLLNKEVEFIDIDLKDKERSLKDVEKIVAKKLNEYENIEFIHLNYTGGTKSMAIGTFLAIDNFDNVKNKIFSDIGFDKKLYLKRGEVYPENGRIIDNLDIKIDEILKLSDKKYSELLNIEYNYDNKFSEFYNKEFAKFLLNKSLKNEKEFFEKVWDKNFKELKLMNWKLSLTDAPINFDLETISNKKLERLQKFIKGLWLEDYLFEFLNENRKKINFDNIVMNLEKKENKKSLVEIDIVLSKGYDLYLFSCTTGYKKPNVKGKVFEAYKRSEDLGGIGAKSVVVSLADENTIKQIYNDDSYTYVGKKSPELIGKEELLDEEKLLNKLKEIIQ